MDCCEELEIVLNKIKIELRRVNIEINRLPKGSLMISSNGPDRISIFQRKKIDGKNVCRGIGSDKALTARLARKAYLLEYRDRLLRSERMIRDSLASLPDLSLAHIRRSLPKHFELIPDSWLALRTDPQTPLSPVFDGPPEPEMIRRSFEGGSPSEWMSRPYRANSSHPEHLLHRTARGFLCRSKSEAAIASIYDELGIPYHYDELLTNGWRYISPDFIGIRRDGQFIYHEHWGMFSAEYASGNLAKLQEYLAEDILPGRDLLVTFDDESGGLDLQLIKDLIKNIYRLD